VSERKKRPYTGFGKTLRRFMWDRDIRSWAQLAELMESATGRVYSHQSMSKYAAGTTNLIPAEFVQDFATALELSEIERLDLAEQFTYHSRPQEPRQNSA
jgi:hypothetical protein